MSCSVACRKLSGRWWKIGSRTGDFHTLNDHGTIMQRRSVLENGTEQLAGYNGIHRCPGFDIVTERMSLFDGYQGTGLSLRHFRTGLDQLIHQIFTFIDRQRGNTGKHIGFTDFLQNTTNFRLEDNDDRNHTPIHDGIRKICDGVKSQKAGSGTYNDYEQYPLEYLDGTRIVFHDFQAVIDKCPDTGNVQQLLNQFP